MNKVGMAAMVAAGVLAGPIYAQTTSVEGALNASQLWDAPRGGGGSVLVAYEAFNIVVTDSSTFNISSNNSFVAGRGSSSRDFDLYLFLPGFGPSAPGTPVAYADSGGPGGFNDPVLSSAAEGEYVLVATTYSALAEGAFTLTATGVVFRRGIDVLTATTGTSARLVVIGADGVARDAGQVSIAARGDQLTLTRVEDGTGAGDVTASTSGIPGMMGNLYTWAEVTGFRSDSFGSGDGTLGGNGLQIGADIAIGPNMVAGLSLGYSMVTSSDGGTTNEGTLTYLQPYFSYSSGAWSGNASLVYGMGSFDQTTGGATGTADVTLAAVTFEGGYDIALNDAFTLTPTIGLIHGREEVEGTSGTLVGASSEVTFSQASLGARVTHVGPNGTLFAGLHADYLTNETESVLTQDLLANDGWTGRVEVGGEMTLDNGMDLSTSVELSGLGGDMQTVSGALRVALRF